MSGEQIRLQVPPKLFGVNSWIAQMIRQWIPDCWYGERKCTGPKSAIINLYHTSQLVMDSFSDKKWTV